MGWTGPLPQTQKWDLPEPTVQLEEEEEQAGGQEATLGHLVPLESRSMAFVIY